MDSAEQHGARQHGARQHGQKTPGAKQHTQKPGKVRGKGGHVTPCPRARPSPVTTPRGPDPELFERRAGATWCLRPGALVTAPDPAPEAWASAQRARLALVAQAPTGQAPEAQDVQELPDDLLITAARVGALMCTAFLDILDGSSFTPAPCICCYAASAAQAREIAASIQAFRRYYNAASYVQSRAYARAVKMMAQDLGESELAGLKNEIYHAAGGGFGRDAREPALVREANAAVPGLCVAVPPCRPDVLWVYSTADGRRLLRHLARKAKAPVRVTVASSDATYSPRWRYRMYAATLLTTREEGPGMLGIPPSLLEETVAWAQKKAGHGT